MTLQEMTLQEEIVGLICKTLELDINTIEIHDDEHLFESIGVDSTEMVEIVVTLKKYFDISIETDEITKFSTLNKIVSIIENKIK